jgi:hypothetical protein
VSGFQTTGNGGQFNAVRSSTGIPRTTAPDPSASRYSMETTGSTRRIFAGGSYIASPAPPPPPFVIPPRSSRRYAPTTLTPARPPPAPIFSTRGPNTPATYSVNTAEPTFEQRLEDEVVSTTPPGLARHQRLQAQLNPHRSTLLDQQAERGLYADDMQMQEALPRLDRRLRPNLPHGDVATPQRPLRLQFSPVPQTNPRTADGHQGSGTINNTAAIPQVQFPGGQSDFPFMQDRNTPAVMTPGYTNPANHPMYGPVPTPGVDGSWTLDVMPGTPAPTLATLAPAADIPVQTAGPGRLGSTAPFVGKSRGPGRMHSGQQGFYGGGSATTNWN